MLRRRHKPVIGDNSTRVQLMKLSLMLIAVLSVHTLAMIRFEGLSLNDALWLTLTSATTVGYGDLSAKTLEGRLATITLIYLAGIAILAQVAALYFEHRQEIRNRKLKGEWYWDMKDHVVFINCPNEAGEEYYFQAITQLRSSHLGIADIPVIILCNNFRDGLPERLRQLDVVHASKPVIDDDSLLSVSIMEANTIVVLAKDSHDPASDSLTFDITSRLGDMGVTARIICEAVCDHNRTRMKKAGASNVLRPIRSYPELLVRTILSPGSEQIVEDLFDSTGEECIRYDVEVTAKWADILKSMVDEDIGTPLGYENLKGEVVANAHPQKVVNTAAVFVIVRDDNLQSSEAVQEKVKSRLAA